MERLELAERLEKLVIKLRASVFPFFLGAPPGSWLDQLDRQRSLLN